MKGWLGLAAFVAVYDGWVAATGRPTLSAEFCAASKAHPIAVGAATAYLVTHLYGYWPRRVDPLYGYIKGGGLLLERAKRAKAPVQ